MSDRFSSADVARQLDDCTYCPKMCRHACPVSTTTGRETLIPQAKMDRLNRLRRGLEPWRAETADPLWACTGCRHCTVYCEHDNQPGLVLLAGRAAAQRAGAGHPALAGYGERFRARDVRLAAAAKENFEDFAESGTVGFWPGCDSLDKGGQDVAAAQAVFARLGVGPVPLVDAGLACAGYPLLAAGLTDEFRWHASKVATALRRFQTIVIGCSACHYAINALYQGEGVAVATEVVSIAEFLARHADRLPAPERKRPVYYHDPCYLARSSGVTAEPRRALAAVAEVREFAWHASDAECCGGGGLLPKTMPATADAMARRRLAEVASAGGGVVATACGTCTLMLRRNAPEGVEVTDLATAIARATDTAFAPPAAPADEP
ncbi:MAG: (Fe-S)-binding protein [Kofleriaceae bacterium]|nr:(Fe-S)-binding protein [Kofleriaceae bacterium]MBP9165813.1 (Fe-S)-binding protein [Kofleriaceae bacterium]MBP9857962.1 (Fe-S)-binding protein [Kofleriaceae bacterium]